MAIFMKNVNLTILKKSEKKQKHNETRAMQEQYFDVLPFFCRYIEAWNLKNAFEALERMANVKRKLKNSFIICDF